MSEASRVQNPPKNRTATTTRLSADVKSALYKCLKWDFEDGTFALRVPATPDTRPLRDWLWKQREPMAQYHAREGHVVAWQWRLKFGEHRNVWAVGRQ